MTTLLQEVNTLSEKEETKEKKGTYVGAKFSEETANKIKAMIDKLGVAEAIASDSYHTTIIFSRKKFEGEFTPLGKIKKPWVGKPLAFDLFTGRNGQNCLVLKYECKEQKERHEYLMDKYDAEYDWPEYKVHLTLSYDCGDFDYKAHDPKDLLDEIIIDEEYTEELNLNWLANKK